MGAGWGEKGEGHGKGKGREREVVPHFWEKVTRLSRGLPESIQPDSVTFSDYTSQSSDYGHCCFQVLYAE